MKTVSVVAQKGGTGKTTLCLAIACAAVRDGLTAAVVDLDPQATAASWGDRRGSGLPVVVSAQPPRLARVLDAAAEQGVDLAVVDTAPRVEQSAVAAARAADLVVVPCRPAVYDLETVAATVDVIRAVAPATCFLCVLNGVPPRGPRQPQARRLLADMGVPVCTASLGLRAAVDYAAAAGASAQEYDPRGKAAAETAAVYDAVRRLVDLPTSRQDHLPTAGRGDLYTAATDHLPTSDSDDLRTSPQRPLTAIRQAGLSAGREDGTSASRSEGLPEGPETDLSTGPKDHAATGRQVDPSTSPTADMSTSAATESDAGQTC